MALHSLHSCKKKLKETLMAYTTIDNQIILILFFIQEQEVHKRL